MRDGRLWRRVFAPFAAAYFFSYFLRNANAVIAPELTRELGIGAADLGLLTSTYLLAFALAQLPLGIALDRYGPRRVESLLLMLAALGCALFAQATTLAQLTLARFLIGFGVSACLMAAIVAFGAWFGRERQASLNASIMVAGGLGALTATTPLTWAVAQWGWRAVFMGLALFGALGVAAILSTPDAKRGTQVEAFRDQIKALAGILASRPFLRAAPPAMLIVGGFMAIQGLWAVPWLMTVGGLTKEAAANHLLSMGVGLLLSFFALSQLVLPLARRGVSNERLLEIGQGVALLIAALIVADMGAYGVLWFGLGFTVAFGNLSYAALQQHYPPALAGRVNTALNLMVFVGAFSVQWGFGAAVDTLVAAGLEPAPSYRTALGGLLIMQAASWWHFVRR
jgi:MFS family permease